MSARLRSTALALACLSGAASARAEIALSSMAWQAPVPGKKGVYASADRWVPGEERVRVLLTLENRGSNPEQVCDTHAKAFAARWPAVEFPWQPK